MKIKRKLKKKEEKRVLVSKAKDYTKISTDEGLFNDGPVKFMQALQKLF